MGILPILILVSLALGAAGLAAFLWSVRSGQYDDLEGAAERVLLDHEDGPPTAGPERSRTETPTNRRPTAQPAALSPPSGS